MCGKHTMQLTYKILLTYILEAYIILLTNTTPINLISKRILNFLMQWFWLSFLLSPLLLDSNGVASRNKQSHISSILLQANIHPHGVTGERQAPVKLMTRSFTGKT